MLEHLVVHRLLLNLASLVHGLHRSEHATALVNAVKFQKNSVFDQVGKLFDDKGTLNRILVFGQAKFLVDNQLNGHRTAHTFFGRSRDCLVVGIGMQRVAVVVDGIQGLQRGSNVVKINLLSVQGPARGLNMVLQHLRPGVRSVLIFHGFSPNPACHASDYGILRVDSVAKEKAQVRAKCVDVHASAEVVLDVGESVGQGECKLRNRVSPRFGNVVATDRHRVEIPHLAVNEVGLHVTHQAKRKFGAENAGVLRLILLENVRLNRSPHLIQSLILDGRIDLCRQHFVARNAEEHEAQSVVTLRQRAVVARTNLTLGFVLGLQNLLYLRLKAMKLNVLLALLVDRGIQEKSEHHRGGPVNGHGHRGGGVAEIKSAVQALCVVEAADRNPGVAELSINIGAATWVASIKCYRIKSSRKPFGRRAQRHIVKALIGPLWTSLAGKHARWILALALKGVQSCRVGEHAWYILLKLPAKNITPAAVGWSHNLGNIRIRKGLRVGGELNVLAPNLVDVLGVFVALP